VTLEGDPYGAAVLVGDPTGEYWQLTQELFGPEGASILQPTLAGLADGSTLMLLRTNQGHIWRARSDDRGRTWSDPEPTAVPNNHSGIDLARLAGGTLLLACNPVSDRELRTPLVLMRSTDEGENWDTVATLEDGEGEFSYPAIIVAGDGAVHLSYTHRRTRIRHAAFPPGRLK
jgi:predicted neuraminidase